MAMFDDPKKELAKLEQQLLQEEEWFSQELDLAKALIGEEPESKPAKKAASNAKNAQPKEAPKKKGVKGLVILAVLETLGIVGVVAYWILFLL